VLLLTLKKKLKILAFEKLENASARKACSPSSLKHWNIQLFREGCLTNLEKVIMGNGGLMVFMIEAKGLTACRKK